MNTSGQDPVKQNAIAYNIGLREQLQALHEMLGYEIANIVSKAIESGSQFSAEAEKALFAMSELTSKLTLALMNARKSKKVLNENEQKDYNRIKAAAATLGNLQAKVNKVLKLSKQINSLNLELKHTAIGLAEDITVSQQLFHEIRADINDLGPLSRDPDLAFYLKERDNSTSY